MRAGETRLPDPGRSGRRGMLPGLLCLLATAGVVAGCGVVLGPDRPGWPGAIAFAAVVTVPGAALAWILAHLPRRDADPGVSVATALAGMALRIMPPLAALAWLSNRPGGPPDPAAATVLVGFYLTLLAVDVVLHIMMARPSARDAARPD